MAKEQVFISNTVVCIFFGIFFCSLDDTFLKTLKLAYNMKNMMMMMMMIMTTILVVMMTRTTGMLMAVVLVVMIDIVDGDNTLYVILTSVILSLCKLENIYEQKTNREVINGSGSTSVGK